MNTKKNSLIKLAVLKTKVFDFFKQNILGKKVTEKKKPFQDDRDGEDACLFVEEKKGEGDYDGTPY